MYVIFPANPARVAETGCHGVDRLGDVAVGFASAGGDTHAPQFDRGKHGAAPGAEVLGADVAPGERAQIGIDVIRGDRLALAGGVEVLEQLLAGQVAAALDDVRKARLGERDDVLDAALAAEAEAQRRAVDLHVAAAQRGKAVRAVRAHVFVVADADQRLVEERDDRGEELPPAQRRRAQIVLEALAQSGQHFAELQHAAEFRLVARVAVGRVIAVLLSPARVARRGLDVAAGIRADPDIGPSRRERQCVQPFPNLAIGDPAAVGRVVSPAAADAPAPDAARAVRDVAQPGLLRCPPVLMDRSDGTPPCG